MRRLQGKGRGKEKEQEGRTMDNVLAQVLAKIMLGVVNQMEPKPDIRKSPVFLGIVLLFLIGVLVRLIYQHLQAIGIL
jgi:hypothetical protein